MKRNSMEAWDEPAFGYCNNCGKRVSIVCEDCGYGSTEYWGAVSTHHNWVYVCADCGEEVEDIY